MVESTARERNSEEEELVAEQAAGPCEASSVTAALEQNSSGDAKGDAGNDTEQESEVGQVDQTHEPDSDPAAGRLASSWAALACILLACLLAFSLWPVKYAAQHPASDQSGPRFVLDVNQATADELQALPEVGPSLARQIVAHRDAHGPFQDQQELLDVHGLGPRTLERLADMVAVGSD